MSTPSFEEQVKQTLANVTTGEDGKTIWPEADESVLYAARAEKRYRDTQSTFTKGQQRLKILEEEKNQLVGHLEEIATVSLSESEKSKLDELKYSDPEAWREQMNTLEVTAKNKLAEKLTEISGTASKKGELVAREQMLQDFLNDNPGLAITDEVIENDIPPRITKKLADGKVTFEEFLNECKGYLSKGKVIAKGETLDDPNLGSLPGAGAPSDNAVDRDSVATYESEIY